MVYELLLFICCLEFFVVRVPKVFLAESTNISDLSCTYWLIDCLYSDAHSPISVSIKVKEKTNNAAESRNQSNKEEVMNKWNPEKLQKFIENIETVKVIDLEYLKSKHYLQYQSALLRGHHHLSI
jgi:hypothetical protein